MNQPTNLSERLRGIAAKAGAEAHATQAKVQEKVQAKEQTDVAQQTSDELKIKENPFYKTLTDPQATQEDKISQIADALNPKDQSMDKVRQNFIAFQQYYTYVQSQDLEMEVANIEQLIEELRNNTKIEVAAILKNLKGMLDDVKQARDLVEVLRKARLSGKTIEELSAAMDRNEEVVKALDNLNAKRKQINDSVAAAQVALDSNIKRREAENAKLGNRVLSIFGRKDQTWDNKVAFADNLLGQKKTLLTQADDAVADLSKQRDKDLEGGPLTILRSFDEAGDNLTDRLMSSGKKGVQTIRGAQQSVLQLMSRALNNESGVDEISRRLADKQIELTILKSGLGEASKNTNEFKEGLQAKSADAETALADARGTAAPDVLDVAKKETAAINVRTNVGEAIDYQTRLNDTLTEMNVTVSKNIEHQGEIDRSKEIVQGTKKSITVLGRDTLNTVAGNLSGVLRNLVADQTDETQQAIAAFAHAAEDVKQGSMEGMMARKKDMHDKDMSLLDDTITRLNASSDMIAQALEVSVAEGAERSEKQKKLQEATAGVDLAMQTMRNVAGKMSNDSVQPQK